MYPGWLSLNGFGGSSVEIINTHRAVAYAQKAGMWWVQGCEECAPIGEVANPDGYLTPLLDEKAGNPPPWWDGNNVRDSENFLGIIGVNMSGADDSTRQIDLIEGSLTGGYLGSMGFRARTIVIRAILIATDDCALGFGLAWLRAMDASQACYSSTFGLYECCPCMCAPECDDPACQAACVLPRRREVRSARLADGPKVLRRRPMSVGIMAEVEMQVVAGDPALYTVDQVVAAFVTEGAVAHSDTQVRAAEPEDPFARYSPYSTAPARHNAVEPRVRPRSDWLRHVAEVPMPVGMAGGDVVPTIRLWAPEGTAEDVRVTLRCDDADVADFRVPVVPEGGTVSVDLGRRRVSTESGGVERENLSFAMSGDGRLVRWPSALPRGEYEVVVDRAPWSPPVGVQVEIAGRSIG